MGKVLFNDKADCMGCSACFAACPKNAIEMKADSEGFLYPQIQEAKCIDCGKCERVCPLKNERSERLPLCFLGAKHKDPQIRASSSSGGVFSLLAEGVQQAGGVIYGAAFDKSFSVKHMRAETEDAWHPFRTSKYVQSDMGNCFAQVEKDLQAGRKVLFTGTPCQVDGLKRYLGSEEKMTNLLTCDIICHGVPSPRVWKDWLESLKSQGKFAIGRINFRDKENVGWHRSTVTIWDLEGKVRLKEGQTQALFFRLFFNHLILRPACHRCGYASFNRPGDITLGDFWGVEKQFPEFDDDKGVSLVMCNTQKGREQLSCIFQALELQSAEQAQCVQPNLEGPSTCYGDRAGFWREYDRFGLTHAAKYAGHVPLSRVEGLWYRVYRKVVRILSRKR